MKYIIIYFLVVVGATSCFSSDPKAIEYGKDQCAFCMMTISDPKFGAELITDKGRVLKYDAAECLAGDLEDGSLTFSKLLAVPYDKPNSLVDVDSLYFLISHEYTSPMGADLVAFTTIKGVSEKHHHSLIDWYEVKKRLAE